ncbi:hypothetical protein [Paracraurococcus lichenis]|uniref:Uncharacterized protein n=1 Tax=Paracraurococcus lichenis TaxID=3064888 RepID=A0ABT9DY92_9PROT|nr:hypothetical protein [Paracraurococcus sp. LOR1-02]MDO9708869.1 hypothetical protein [Paracraurococcus sp. LOR1-02]
MRSGIRLLPPRRHRHGHGREAGGLLRALLAGMRPGPVLGGAPPAAARAPEPVRVAAGPAEATAPEAWSRFQSSLAAGG